MALVLKAGKSYSASLGDAFGFPMVGSDFYAVIDQVEYNKAEKRCSFSVLIYADSVSRTANKNPMDVASFHFDEAKFNEHVGNDGMTIPEAYAYTLNQTGFAHWESDE